MSVGLNHINIGMAVGKKKEAHELICKEEDGLEREMSVADLEEILQGGAEEINDHDIIVALFAGVHDPGHAWTTHERLVDFGFLAERGCEGAGNGWLELDSDFFSGYGVHTEEDGAYEVHETGTGTCARTRYAPQPPLAISSSSLYLPPNVTSIETGGRGQAESQLVSVFWFWF